MHCRHIQTCSAGAVHTPIQVGGTHSSRQLLPRLPYSSALNRMQTKHNTSLLQCSLLPLGQPTQFLLLKLVRACSQCGYLGPGPWSSATVHLHALFGGQQAGQHPPICIHAQAEYTTNREGVCLLFCSCRRTRDRPHCMLQLACSWERASPQYTRALRSGACRPELSTCTRFVPESAPPSLALRKDPTQYTTTTAQDANYFYGTINTGFISNHLLPSEPS